MICKVCEGENGCLPQCQSKDLQTILDCMSGADGGAAYVMLRSFMGLAAKQGQRFPAITQLAALIRRVSPSIDG